MLGLLKSTTFYTNGTIKLQKSTFNRMNVEGGNQGVTMGAQTIVRASHLKAPKHTLPIM